MVTNTVLGVFLMINKNAILVEQQNLTHVSSLEPFIYTDLLAEYAGNELVSFFHFWNMTNQVILGMKDTRVTFLDKGIESIQAENYNVVVRNSGGLAVVADEGILNFSIIIPQPKEKYSFTIDDGYSLMKVIIEKALSDFSSQIDAFEVTDSYCPGDFDLSINGKKFAGISQRRIKKGIGIMIYLSVDGNQEKRGKMVRNFYKEGLEGQFGKDGFPPVNPNSMANLSDLLQTKMTIDEMKNRIIHVLNDDYLFDKSIKEKFDIYQNSNEFKENYDKQEIRMIQRNDIIHWSETV